MSDAGIPNSTDVLVIGGGSGGYVAAIRAGQLDMDVTLVEKDAFGGTCLNYGCIPSKALITASNLAFEAGNAERMGIYGDFQVDLSEMVDWKEGIVSNLTNGVEGLCRTNGVQLVNGEAKLVDEHSAVIRSEGEKEPIEFQDAIIATGSRPVEIPGFSYSDGPILNSKQALALESLPEKLAIIGAGYIGIEMAGVFAKLGSDVTVVEMLDSIIPMYADDLVAPVRERAEDLGINFRFGEMASEWELAGDRVTLKTETEDGEERTLAADKVLVAVGREPVTDTVGVQDISISVTENGFIDTNERCQTNYSNIYAVGDTAGEPLLAHKASMEGKTAAEVIAGEPAAVDYQTIPAVVFTEPEIAQVGWTPERAQSSNIEFITGEFPFSASGRALTTGTSEGFVRLIADEETGMLLGGQLVGPEASELVGEVGLAIEMGATIDDVSATIHTHPTLSEAVMEAAENASGRAIHIPNN